MLNSRQNNKKINHVHESCQRIIQNTKLSSYEQLLEKKWSVCVYYRNFQNLAIEMLQINYGQSRKIGTYIFTQTKQE